MTEPVFCDPESGQRGDPALVRRRANRVALAVLLCAAGSSPALAQMYKPGSKDAVPPAELFQACGFCHGDKAQGRQRLDAPAIAGLQSWYLERQMHNFRNGIRGVHPEDVPGEQMAMITGMFRNDATIAALAAYIQALPPGAAPMAGRGPGAQPEPIERPYKWKSRYASVDSAMPGNVAAGKKIYQETCMACHGADGQGVQALGAPRLTVLASWYMGRELKYFRDGIRGTDPKDTFGALMVPSSKLLANDQAIADVLAYVRTL
jgi:cytochrome c oxidase subunit 2